MLLSDVPPEHGFVHCNRYESIGPNIWNYIIYISSACCYSPQIIYTCAFWGAMPAMQTMQNAVLDPLFGFYIVNGSLNRITEIYISFTTRIYAYTHKHMHLITFTVWVCFIICEFCGSFVDHMCISHQSCRYIRFGKNKDILFQTTISFLSKTITTV